MNSFLHAFPGQEEHESTYIFARPYIVSFLPTALFYMLVIFLCIIFQWSIRLGWIQQLSSGPTNLIVALAGLLELVSTMVFFIAVFDFYDDIFIVTDRRLTEIQQERLLYRKYAQLSLEDIEDVSSHIDGFLPTVFGYGNVLVQTAGEQTNFMIDNIQHPHEIAALILDLADQAKRGVKAEDRVPQRMPMAFLNDIPVENIAQLMSMGAIDTDDDRITEHNAAYHDPAEPATAEPPAAPGPSSMPDPQSTEAPPHYE